MLIRFRLHMCFIFPLLPILEDPGRRHCIVAYEPLRKFCFLHRSRSRARIVCHRQVKGRPINHKYSARDLGEDIILQPCHPVRKVHFFVVGAGTLYPDKQEASTLQQARLLRADVGDDDMSSLPRQLVQSRALVPVPPAAVDRHVLFSHASSV